ncbi:MAG: hypothetical protein LBT40_18070 [Deltaproteobacteria bacterium]|nr:hypothetical protein [Deltaproteobacteria bacterium]
MSADQLSRAPSTRCRIGRGAHFGDILTVLALGLACAFLAVFAGACMPYPLG